MDQLEPKVSSVSERSSVFTAALHVFGVIPQALSMLLSFTVVAYAVGWFQARAYFRAFSAGWLLSQLSAVELLQFSWIPIFLVALFMWLGLTDLAETGERRDSRRFRATLFFLRYGWGVLLVLLITTYAVEALGHLLLARALAGLTMLGYALFASAVFEAIVIRVKEGRFIGDLGDAHLVYAIVIAGFYFVPTLNGHFEGKAAADPTRSNLPIVRTTRANDKDLRLILLSQGTAYAADLADGTQSKIKIHTVPVSELGSCHAKVESRNSKYAEQNNPCPNEVW